MTPFASQLGNRRFIDIERDEARQESEALRLLYAAHGRAVRCAPRRRWWLDIDLDRQETP